MLGRLRPIILTFLWNKVLTQCKIHLEGLHYNSSGIQLTTGLINKVSWGQLRVMKEQRNTHRCHVFINHWLSFCIVCSLTYAPKVPLCTVISILICGSFLVKQTKVFTKPSTTTNYIISDMLYIHDIMHYASINYSSKNRAIKPSSYLSLGCYLIFWFLMKVWYFIVQKNFFCAI